MKIRNILLLGFSITLIVFTAFGLIYLSAGRRVEESRLKNIQVKDMLTSVTQIRELSYEYLLDPNERIRNQWDINFNHISEVINTYRATTEEDGIVQRLKQSLIELDEAFLSLVKFKGESSELDSRLEGRILVVSQDIVYDSLLLADINDKEFTKFQNLSQRALLVWVLVTLVILTSILVVFQNRIVGPVTKLEEATRIVAEGNLDHVVSVKGRDEISQLARSFNKMTEKLKELDKLKTDFLMVTAHQLRTPLGAVRWRFEMLEQVKGEKNILKKVKEITGMVKSMIEVVNGLLNVTRFEAGQIGNIPSKIDISQNINEEIKKLEPIIISKGVKIIVEKGNIKNKITIDPWKFTTVLNNVLQNAIFYSKKGDMVRIKATEAGGKIEISVNDEGIGIPEKEIHNIFSKFFRASNAIKHKPDGDGLGLYLSKSIVDSWGGEIKIDSSEGKGTTVSFTVVSE